MHLFISSDDDVKRCRESLQFGKPLSIWGEDTLTGRVKSLTGVVLSIESRFTNASGERWLIKVDDA